MPLVTIVKFALARSGLLNGVFHSPFSYPNSFSVVCGGLIVLDLRTLTGLHEIGLLGTAYTLGFLVTSGLLLFSLT